METKNLSISVPSRSPVKRTPTVNMFSEENVAKPIPAFVHTSAFSIPVTPAAPSVTLQKLSNPATIHFTHGNLPTIVADETNKQSFESIKTLLQSTLDACSRLATDNSQLEAEKKRLEDLVVILKNTIKTSATIPDPKIIDASISSLRGRLLEESRQENEKLRRQVAEQNIQLRAFEHELHTERAKWRDQEQILKQLDDCSALSDARARTVERLDEELVKSRVEVTKYQNEASLCRDKLDVAEHDLAEVKTSLRRSEEEVAQLKVNNERINERLLSQGLDLRVVRSQIRDTALAPATSSSVSSNTLSSSPVGESNSKVWQRIEREREDSKVYENELKRQIETLRKELDSRNHERPNNEALFSSNNSPARSRLIDALRHQLSEAIAELKLVGVDRARERGFYNGQLAAYSARMRSLEQRVRKDVQQRRELKFYKILAKRYQAELAAYIARSSSAGAKVEETPLSLTTPSWQNHRIVDATPSSQSVSSHYPWI